MPDPLRLAFGTLTTWRVPPPRNIDTSVAGHAMVIAPLVMAPLLGLLALGAWALTVVEMPSAVIASLGVATLTLSTRAMHLDGLADTADGLSASYDREAVLRVMKRSDIGPSGVAAVAVCLIVQTAALTALVGAGTRGVALAAACVLTSRASLAWACHRAYPAATESGLGATVARSVSTGALALTTIAVVAASTLLTWWCGAPVWSGLVIHSTGIAGALVLLDRTRRRLGGMTGDVLGASVEISLSVCLVAATALLS